MGVGGVANEEPLGMVHKAPPEGSYIWDGLQMLSYLKRFMRRSYQRGYSLMEHLENPTN